MILLTSHFWDTLAVNKEVELDMSLRKPRERVKDGEAWHAAGRQDLDTA